MWQVSHSQYGRETLAFSSEWFGWMLYSWVPNNVLAGSSKKCEKVEWPATPERLPTRKFAFVELCRKIKQIRRKLSFVCLSSRSRACRIFHRERGCLRRQSANALVNSLAWFFGITGILETFSVSRTAY